MSQFPHFRLQGIKVIIKIKINQAMVIKSLRSMHSLEHFLETVHVVMMCSVTCEQKRNASKGSWPNHRQTEDGMGGE